MVGSGRVTFSALKDRMPELPEAEIAARQLRARLIDAHVAGVSVGRYDIIREGGDTCAWYPGSVVTATERYGKSVVIEFQKAGSIRYLVAELGMTGLLLFPEVAIKFPQHVHYTMQFDSASTGSLRYWNPRRFGRLSLLDRAGLDCYLARRFGCDPLHVTREEFARLLRQCRRRLKAVLMHQQIIAGIGNIYANEALFRAGLHPDVIASQLAPSAVGRLHHELQIILRQAIECGGSSVKDFFAPDGSEGTYKQHHLVYGKEGLPCPRKCGSVIRRVQSERSSFICATCQKIRTRR
jgi:formamidopyrimidine-DNA glycosylase